MNAPCCGHSDNVKDSVHRTAQFPRRRLGLIPVCLLLLAAGTTVLAADGLPDLSTVPPDLVVPEVAAGSPRAGHRVRQTTKGWETTAVYHALYLPTDWRPGGRYPVIVEYAGNGGYKNAFGDVSGGTVDGCRLGYGLTAGKGVIWVCVPFVESDAAGKRNALKWWGEVEETKRYCRATVNAVTAEYGGDLRRVVLAGFSRGSIACNFIGLHGDAIAPLWRAFFCHSHYDGVKANWPYAGADRAAAVLRLGRLNGRPQWISHEGGGVTATQEYLQTTGVAGAFTFQPLNFRNHSGDWLLRDIPERRAARRWLEQVLSFP